MIQLRDYTPLLRIEPGPDDQATMQRVVDGLWEQFKGHGLSWIGFYLRDPENAEQMVLGPRRDKPACSPIGMHGACGRSFLSRRPLVVTDVKKLGEGYIACDPRDQSECVVPALNPDGSAWAVLDADSFDVGSFTKIDALALWRLLRHVGLSAHTVEDESRVEIV
jgi:putative methionine-R-sulfoxide reductase with GAF domain